MNLTIANISKTIATADFNAAVAAIGRQVSEHFQPEWDRGATLNGVALNLHNHKAPIQGVHDAILYLGDSSQDPTTGIEGALGYHAANHADVPYGFVYLDICQKYKEVWSCTLSHEVLELLGDPDARLTVSGPAPNGAGSVYYDLEVCDPTQGDSYSIDNITVSNFIGRNYFGLAGGSGKTNYLGLPLDQFGVRPQGYFQYEDSTGAHQVFGEKVTQEQKQAKDLMGTARRNGRRKEPLGRRFRVVKRAS